MRILWRTDHHRARSKRTVTWTGLESIHGGSLQMRLVGTASDHPRGAAMWNRVGPWRGSYVGNWRKSVVLRKHRGWASPHPCCLDGDSCWQGVQVVLSRLRSAYCEWGCRCRVCPSGGDGLRMRSRRVSLAVEFRRRLDLPPIERLESFASILMTALAGPLE